VGSVEGVAGNELDHIQAKSEWSPQMFAEGLAENKFDHIPTENR